MSAPGNRRGFTIAELLVAMIIIGILAGIAVLKYVDLRRNAITAKVASEINAVKLAGYSYWGDNQSWPADAGAGVVPAGLVKHLPEGFRFDNPTWKYTLEWDNLGVVAGPGGSPPEYLIGITIATTDARLMQKLESYLGTAAPMFSYGGKLTYVIQAPGGGY
ncbi:MAG TPA: prepilin-type N-terminal cleavage/methylation domain-containing protein [Gemmatimonadales bacterium]|nr:prepilin-type N-terminal cleavage/methylation domain-containing protein [Gemmatimonadales bacterium]